MGGTDYVAKRLLKRSVHLTPKQLLFLEWLVNPDKEGKGSQSAWAEANGISEKSVREWKKDPAFLNAWHYRMYELNVNPGRIG